MKNIAIYCYSNRNAKSVSKKCWCSCCFCFTLFCLLLFLLLSFSFLFQTRLFITPPKEQLVDRFLKKFISLYLLIYSLYSWEWSMFSQIWRHQHWVKKYGIVLEITLWYLGPYLKTIPLACLNTLKSMILFSLVLIAFILNFTLSYFSFNCFLSLISFIVWFFIKERSVVKRIINKIIIIINIYKGILKIHKMKQDMLQFIVFLMHF